ncbi:MAG: glycine cleavage system protein GcvH [Candidatus Hadarchaeales archaeon]
MGRGEIKIPEDLRYTKDHEWARAEGKVVRVGVTDYAQAKLGDVVYVELPSVGKSVRQLGDKKERDMEVAILESIKAVSAVYAPVSGTIREVNAELRDRPELVNTSPYDRGWICTIEPKDPDEIKKLMSAREYEEYLKALG